MAFIDVNPTSVALTVLPYVGFVVYFLTEALSPHNWRELRMPSFAPPEWAYPTAYAIIYGAQGYASYLAFRATNHDLLHEAMTSYWLLLLVAWGSMPIFAGMRLYKLGVLTSAAETILVALIAKRFFDLNAVAGVLVLPYLIWQSCMLILTVAMWKLNCEEEVTYMPNEEVDNEGKFVGKRNDSTRSEARNTNSSRRSIKRE